MNIVAGLSGLKAAADMTKALRDGLKAGQIKADEIAGRIGEIYDYIIDSKMALVDAQQEQQTLHGEIAALKKEAASLKSRLEEKDAVVYHDGACWRQYSVKVEPPPGGDPDAEYSERREDGPFCPSCWPLIDKLIPGQINHVEDGYVKFYCNNHKSPVYFDVPERLVKNRPLDPHRAEDEGPDFAIIPGPRPWG